MWGSDSYAVREGEEFLGVEILLGCRTYGVELEVSVLVDV